MINDKKMSASVAAEYLGISAEALDSLTMAGWITPESRAGSIPIYLKENLFSLKQSMVELAARLNPIDSARASIRERYQNALNDQAKISALIADIRNECKHPAATRDPKSDTGNWDRSQDSYWYDCKCPDCGKFWSEDQ